MAALGKPFPILALDSEPSREDWQSEEAWEGYQSATDNATHLLAIKRKLQAKRAEICREQEEKDIIPNRPLGPMENFESWLLHRVAQAVEAGEMSADLLADLHAECEAARARPQEESHDAATQHIADPAGVPAEQAGQT